jgi:nucleolin
MAKRTEGSKSAEESRGKKRRRRSSSSKRGGAAEEDAGAAAAAAAAAADSELSAIDAAPAPPSTAPREGDDEGGDDGGGVPSRGEGGGGASSAASSSSSSSSDDGNVNPAPDAAEEATKNERGGEEVGGGGDDGDVVVDGESKKRKRKRNRKKKSGGGGDDDGDGAASSSSANPSADAVDAGRRAELASSVGHTVFVEGLPFASTPEQLRHFFEVHGISDVVDMRLPAWQDSGRLRGFGHVVFASEGSRTRALGDDVNGKELGGRYVAIREANAPRAGTTMGAAALGGGETRDQPGGCRTVFVRNLPYDASEEDILESFRVLGKVVEGGVRLARNHVTGASKGFGYVEYKNEEGALAAVQKAAKPFGILVSKRPVFVDYDEGTMKGSFRDGEGKLWSKEHDNHKRGGGPAASGGRGGRGGGRGGFGGRGGGTGFGGRGFR